MNIDANDPKWTEYALGELTDEKERAEMESILAESPEMRQLVEEIRRTAEMLKRELLAEQSIGLTPAQRTLIEEKANARRNWLGFRPAWVLAAAAAVVLMLSVVTFRQLRQAEQAPSNDQLALVIPKESAPITPPQPASPVAPKASPGSVNADTVEAKKKGEPAEFVVSEKLKSAAVSKETEPLAEKQDLIVGSAAAVSAAAPAPQLAPQKTTLEGLVVDATGGILPGVALTVKDQYTGATRKTVTNSAGRYAFSDLPPGHVSLQAEMPGFQTKTVRDIALNEQSRNSLNLNMDVASMQNEIQISVAAENILTKSSSSAANATPMEKEKALPPGSGNVMDLMKVMSGVKMARTPVDEVRGRRGWWPPTPPPHPRQRGDFNTEAYENISDNPFLDVTQNPLSTFSIDVDTASYSNVRRFLDSGKLPPKDAVRIEELVNYFDYDYKAPRDGKPFAASFELTEAPWKPEHKLLRIGLKGREIAAGKRPDSNLVFLLDVSGSMADENKLPLVKQAMTLLVDQLTESDRVAIVVYASDTRIVLPSTSGDQKEKIRHAIERLYAGGSTNGASGIQLAYKTAADNFIKGGVNRVLLATDGDFNVGITNRGDLTRLIEDKAKSGIFLSALGFGMGNYKDSTLELLATKGRGNYAYIDTFNEAKKVLVEQINSTLVSIAKDVKIQVEFNPRRVRAYRLIGYEDRLMAKEDFNDDARQAGVIGAGHAVTALYELVPAGVPMPGPGVDPLKYQKQSQPSSHANSDEVLTVKVRSKEPEGDKSVLSEFAVKDSNAKFSGASQDFKFAASVAAFGMALRDSPYKGSTNLERALEWAKEGKGDDRHGYRQEFIRLIHRAISIAD